MNGISSLYISGELFCDVAAVDSAVSLELAVVAIIGPVRLLSLLS